MKLEFETPTPPSCVECKFHTLVTDGRYGPWVFKCLIDDNIKIVPREGVKVRNADCPGVISEEECE